MAGVEISRAYVGVAGADIRCVNARGMVSVARKDREITAPGHPARARGGAVGGAAVRPRDPARHAAGVHRRRAGRHRRPARHARQPPRGAGPPGDRPDARARKTLLTCVNRAGIEVVEMVFEPLATAEAVLTPGRARARRRCSRHRRRHHRLRALRRRRDAAQRRWLPIGAGHFTNDLAMVLRTPFAEAERIKTKQGCCLLSTGHRRGGDLGAAVAGGAPRVVPQARALRDPAAARRGAVHAGPRRPDASTAGTGACAAASS